MNSTPLFLIAIAALASSALPTGPAALAQLPRPVPLIYDTDIGNDCDDVLAMGMIHSLQSRGECELLAVTITKDHPGAAAMVDAINTFYGRGDIPIGVCDSDVTPLKSRFNAIGQAPDRYPRDLSSGEDAVDAVALLRQTLAAQNDGEAVIVQVGFSTNLANLLASSPDRHSELNGIDLIKQKVRLLSVMAGAFEPISGDNGKPYNHKEYNVVKDIPSAQKLADDWPTPIVWSGFEVGKKLPYPHQSILNDYGYAGHHPLAEAYTLYNPPPHDRPTWDLTSVLYAVRPLAGYFTVSVPGQVSVGDDGLTSFEAADAGRDHYLIVDPAKVDRITEALVLLSSQPPAGIAP